MRTKIKALLSLAALVALTSCFPKHNDPAIYWGQTPAQAQLAATAHAGDINGFQTLVSGISMLPLIVEGDYLVVRPSKDVVIGKIYVYRVQWYPTPVVHRAVAKHGEGWIMSGDNNANSERGDQTVYSNQILGEVIAIYTTRKKS